MKGSFITRWNSHLKGISKEASFRKKWWQNAKKKKIKRVRKAERQEKNMLSSNRPILQGKWSMRDSIWSALGDHEFVHTKKAMRTWFSAVVDCKQKKRRNADARYPRGERNGKTKDKFSGWISNLFFLYFLLFFTVDTNATLSSFTYRKLLNGLPAPTRRNFFYAI